MRKAMQSTRFIKSLSMSRYRSHETSSGSNAIPFQFADVEEEFLHAAEFGDVPNVKKILAENADLNIDCIDALGRTALRLAVKNEHLEDGDDDNKYHYNSDGGASCAACVVVFVVHGRDDDDHDDDDNDDGFFYHGYVLVVVEAIPIFTIYTDDSKCFIFLKTVVEALLEKSNQHHIAEAVLQAISAGHTQIAETILKHRRYLEMWKERRKLGDTDGFYKTAYPDSQFSPDITPLILASQKNQYEIVQLLLLRGDTIHNPHKFSCNCTECRNKMKFDQLRLAKYRLNAYRGLASEAYISLSSKDPILTAFELASELRKLSRVEKHFKREYRDLADQLSDYVVKLLDRIRTQRELELVLNKTGRHHQEKYANLARFKLAIQFKEKKGGRRVEEQGMLVW
ncbi:short transient receptor potential channel 6 [Elysia marginata]|uniref:Short transient receptor potential channel 6 n=1 Tax=Elysia marginata TaxID=1093978 RepID=A0AAV4FCQ2_9GAST|nr:short transient receptor potential channel 6 [Elysia marginata]